MISLAWIVLWFVVWGALVGAIAHARGRDVMAWVMIGGIFGIFALIYLVCIPALPAVSDPAQQSSAARLLASSERKCPECAEMIKVEARKCRYCGSAVEPAARNAPSIQPELKRGDIVQICPACNSVSRYPLDQCFACGGDIKSVSATYFAG